MGTNRFRFRLTYRHGHCSFAITVALQSMPYYPLMETSRPILDVNRMLRAAHSSLPSLQLESMDTLRYLVGKGEHGDPTVLVLAEGGQRCSPTPPPCKQRHPPNSAPFEPSTTPFASTVAYHNDRTTTLEDLISAQRHHITEHDPLSIDILLNTASGRVSLYVRLSFLSGMATQPCIWP